ncbi:MAG: alpha/beta fold hydrolase [Acidimicrobiia bacterium]
MRARYPDRDGFIDRDGVKIHFELYENDGPTILLMPTWSLVHSRHWKMQIPYLARHYRVLTFDGRGNGKSDRPRAAEAHGLGDYLADAIAVMDETQTDRAFLAGMSLGGYYSLQMAARHPDRVLGVVVFGTATGLSAAFPELALPERLEYEWDAELDTTEGWAKYNKHHWLRDYPDFVEFFIGRCITEPHSTKLTDDAIGWALETDGEVLVATDEGTADFVTGVDAAAAYRSIRCPVLIIHGDDDHIISYQSSVKLAEITGGELVTIGGGGHFIHGREPVKSNRLIGNFIDRTSGAPPPSQIWARGLDRPKRALYLSSPIGLGHARRDVAITAELRALRPDLEVDWLAQHPVTSVLEGEGEKVHPASEYLASESGHITSEAGEHDLHCFEALRRMDEILLTNFMVFQEVVDEGNYDLVIADESWDVDHFWFENPELKRGQLVWMTDFVGYIPMPEGGAREEYVTADYNAEMINHVARYPWIRDRAIFVGSPDDIVPNRFGPDLPLIKDWTLDNFDFSGYITGFDPGSLDRAVLRSELGYGSDEKVCVVTVGGSGVGADLIRRVIDAYPSARRLEPGLRMIVVAGPRIDPDSLPKVDGIEMHSHVPRLYRHLAACDVAVVQGGLTTTMELAASQTPFLYFPLRNHFEQNFHVRHRLTRYGAGTYMEYATSDPDAIAQELSRALRTEAKSIEVETDGAARAASMIAELV